MKRRDIQVLGKYDVIEEIGRGSMGTVYLGYDPFGGRKVALKVAHPEASNADIGATRYRKLFFNEAKIAGKLKHPNIVGVYDAGVDGDIWYIVMEYVAGGQTLHSYSKPERLLPIDDVVGIIFKCVKALDYAHRKGVIHRDIKPRNVLVTSDFEVKIGDFGIALMTPSDAAESTQVYGYVGSPLYMSPEQIRMDNITNQSDIFSVGVMTYQMLTGCHPFAADTLPAITHRITSHRHLPLRELRPDAPKILEHIVDRMLAKNVATRYKMGLDVAADLSLIFDHLGPTGEHLPGKEKLNLVKELGFFNDFPESEIWEVINASVWQTFDPGAEIILEGEVDNSFYVIVSGDVVVRKGGKDVDELGRGDCFGEMGFIARQQRSASIIAKSPVTVMQVRSTLMERASLQCQLRFHKIFLYTLVARLSRTTEQFSRSDAPVAAAR